MIAVDKLATCY